MQEPDIIDYLNGHCTAEKARDVEQWIAADPANAATFRRVRRIWEAADSSAPAPAPDIDRAWARVQHRALQKTRVRRLPVLWQRIAAAVLLLLIGYTSYVWAQGPEMVTISSVGQAIPFQVELPDGSTVALNHHSEITYPSVFSGATRPVSLSGEAFFEVARKEEQPFIIDGGATGIQVLGTSFDVMAYPDSAYTQVTVATGRVAFFAKKQEADRLELTAGETARYQKVKREFVPPAEINEDILAWREGALQFTDARLDRVIAILEDFYDIDLQFSDPASANCRLTARLPLNDLSSALEMIRTLFDFEVDHPEEDIYVLQGDGCS